jgi:hypothetical protein
VDSSTTPPDARSERVDEVILAYLEEVDAGRAPQPADYLARYPDLAPDLQSFFADQQQVRRLTAPLRIVSSSSTTSDAPTAGARVAGSSLAAVGGYQLLRLLGAGGMGRVYEAADGTGRRVALKLISPGTATSPVALERFRQEGRLASRITHPRCVFVMTADEEAGQPYIVMELMPGDTLKDLVERLGPLAPADAIAKVLDVLDGLAEAHRAGVIHRDVKPANCYVEANGRIKIGDFGLSRSLTAYLHLTRTGGFVGTPLFASPEQLKGEPLDPRTDVYSVAATLYYLLTGQAPFQGDDGAVLIARVVSEAPAPPRSLRPTIPPPLEAVVLRGLDRQRERRFQDVEELRAALLALLPNRLSAAGVGLRLGAHFLDTLPFAVVGELVGMSLAGTGQHPSLAVYLMLVTPVILYYWLCDGLWGGTPGKRLVRLRVAGMADGEPPGLVRSLVRTGVYVCLTGLVWNLFLYAVLDRSQQLAWPLIQLAGAVVGVPLCFSTMRARNGYRGLHELLSGTRVVQLPAPPRLLTFAPKPIEVEAAACRDNRGPPAELPPQLGPFLIRKVLRWGAGERLLLAEDAVLQRPVWIWLRSPSAPALTSQRRELTRSTRLRWLAEGAWAEWRWDAFVAPSGQPLPELLAEHGRLEWCIARSILEQLTDELQAAGGDGSLPAVLSVENIWMQANGRALLLDRLTALPEEPGTEALALSLLRDVARLTLERRPLGAEENGERPIRAVVPLHARALLDRLTGAGNRYQSVAEVQADLAATHDRPTEVTPALRALNLAAAGCFLAIGLVTMLVWCRIAAVAHLAVLDRYLLDAQVLRYALADEELRQELARRLPADEAALRQLAADPGPIERRAALDRDQLGEKLHRLGLFSGMYRAVPILRVREALGDRDEALQIERAPGPSFTLAVKRLDFPNEEWATIYPPNLSYAAGRAAGTKGPDVAFNQERWVASVATVAFFPAVWVIWAFLFRGGLSLRLSGLALVRSSGRNALRVQCAWRALLIWAPVLALLVTIVWIDSRDDTAPAWLCTTLQGATILLLVAYAALALRFPTRSLHDWLAGTHVVPR